MKYHALFFIFEKVAKFWNCRLLQILGGALWVNNIVVSVKQSENKSRLRLFFACWVIFHAFFVVC